MPFVHQRGPVLQAVPWLWCAVCPVCCAFQVCATATKACEDQVHLRFDGLSAGYSYGMEPMLAAPTTSAAAAATAAQAAKAQYSALCAAPAAVGGLGLSVPPGVLRALDPAILAAASSTGVGHGDHGAGSGGGGGPSSCRAASRPGVAGPGCAPGGGTAPYDPLGLGLRLADLPPLDTEGGDLEFGAAGGALQEEYPGFWSPM